MINFDLMPFTVTGALCVAVLAACVTREHDANVGNVLGTWDYGPAESEFGPIMIRLEFSGGGTLTISLKAMSGDGIPWVLGSGPYHIEKGCLVSSAFDVEPIRLARDGNDLLLQGEGEPAYRFTLAKRGGRWDTGPTIERMRFEVWSACPFELPSQLPDTDSWRNYGEEQVFEGDGWKVKVLCARDQPDGNVRSSLPSARHVAYITLEPLWSGPTGYRMLTNVTSRLRRETGGVWVDPLGMVRSQDDVSF